MAAVPYDVVNATEARSLADGNDLSFLRVSRAEIELPPDTDPYSSQVYDRAAANFAAFRASSLHLEAEPSLYFYRLRMGDHEQVGLAGCFSIAEYDRDVIRKHERTRRDKEDDRTRHMLTLGAQTGPVFLTYRATADVNDIASRVTQEAPLVDFSASDGVQHTLWRVAGADCAALVAAFTRVPVLYIADGHHRAASAARTLAVLREQGRPVEGVGDGAGADTVMAVAFPHDHVQILAYNRVVRDLAGLSADEFLQRVGQAFVVAPGPASPVQPGAMAMYLDRRWYTLTPRRAPDPGDAIAALDVSVLQDQLLGPMLGILDVRTDPRIDFVGGARGTAALEAHVNAGRFAVAFSLHPVGVDELMAVADAGQIMPPKSTWFEPKLRDGLLIHVI